MGGKPSLILSNPPLLLGGSDVAKDAEFMKKSNVEAVLSVCSTACDLRRLKLLHIDIKDRGDVDIAQHFPAGS